MQGVRVDAVYSACGRLFIILINKFSFVQRNLWQCICFIFPFSAHSLQSPHTINSLVAHFSGNLFVADAIPFKRFPFSVDAISHRVRIQRCQIGGRKSVHINYIDSILWWWWWGRWIEWGATMPRVVKHIDTRTQFYMAMHSQLNTTHASTWTNNVISLFIFRDCFPLLFLFPDYFALQS